MQSKHRLLLGLTILFAGLDSAKADAFKTFAVGNSLTVNATLNAMDDMAAQVGIASSSNDHIYLGQSLDTIWNNPQNISSPYGTTQGVDK